MDKTEKDDKKETLGLRLDTKFSRDLLEKRLYYKSFYSEISGKFELV